MKGAGRDGEAARRACWAGARRLAVAVRERAGAAEVLEVWVAHRVAAACGGAPLEAGQMAVPDDGWEFQTACRGHSEGAAVVRLGTAALCALVSYSVV